MVNVPYVMLTMIMMMMHFRKNTKSSGAANKKNAEYLQLNVKLKNN